jgi:hypothetical protein
MKYRSKILTLLFMATFLMILPNPKNRNSVVDMEKLFSTRDHFKEKGNAGKYINTGNNERKHLSI